MRFLPRRVPTVGLILGALSLLCALVPLALSGSEGQGGAAAKGTADAAAYVAQTYPSQRPPVPIVFTSRQRLDSLDGVRVGPPIGPLGRELVVGGSLKVLYPDGRVQDLTAGSGLVDVSRPAVSFDGKKVVFAAVRSLAQQWRIHEINLDGTGLRQLTFDDRRAPIPTDPEDWQRNIALFRRYGDFDPVYLADGRICFVSTRYMAQSGSSGLGATNLYIINSDGSDLRRITSLRSGAMTPYALADGRILYSLWSDNINTPALAGPGWRPLSAQFTYTTSVWSLWVCQPDGSENRRYAYNLGGVSEVGGAFQARELPGGDIIYTLARVADLLGSPLTTAIAKLTPGLVDINYAGGIGDAENIEAAHAQGPAPLPDGSVALAYTPWAEVQRDAQGRRTAEYDYGLYLAGATTSGLALLYNDPATDELDPVAAFARNAPPMLADTVRARASDDPTAPGGIATIHNENVYADLPPHLLGEFSPRAGTAAMLEVYDDAQAWLTAEGFPLLNRQMPRFVTAAPVSASGAVTIEVPADRPLLYVLRNVSGVAVRYSLSPANWVLPSEQRTAAFGHDYQRPGATVQCVGCHRGHTMLPDLAPEARTNLARLATISASSEGDAAARGDWLMDGRLAEDAAIADSASRREAHPWVQLNWPAPIVAERVLLYARSRSDGQALAGVVTLSDGSGFSAGSFPTGDEPLILELGGKTITWARFTSDIEDDALAGLSEWVVNGPADVQFPTDAPQAPSGVTLGQSTLQARWSANPERNLAGYKVHYGLAAGVYTATLNVGDVNGYLLRDLKDGQRYYVAVSAYNTAGVNGPLSASVEGVARWPVVRKITPNRGPAHGDTLVTIQGDYLGKGARVLIGGQPAYDVRWRDSHTIIAFTSANAAGPADVVVVNPDDSLGTLVGGFAYEAAGETPTPTATWASTSTRTPLPRTATATESAAPPVPTASPSRTLVWGGGGGGGGNGDPAHDTDGLSKPDAHADAADGHKKATDANTAPVAAEQ